jgi:hypothetical protein
MSYKRRLEPASAYIFEFWNTISNIPFILFGVTRLCEGTELTGFYVLLILCGICSGIHHAIDFPYSVVLDWTPISIALAGILYHQVYLALTLTTWLKIVISITILLTDHILQPMPPPFQHVIWHISAAFSADAALQDYEGLSG